MNIQVGKTYEGTIERVLPYGVFVLLPGGESGLLHKSKIKEHLKFTGGERIAVKVLSISKEGKIDLAESNEEPDEKDAAQLKPSDMFGLASGIKITEDKSLDEQLKKFANKSRGRLGDALEWELRKSGKKKKK